MPLTIEKKDYRVRDNQPENLLSLPLLPNLPPSYPVQEQEEEDSEEGAPWALSHL